MFDETLIYPEFPRRYSEIDPSRNYWQPASIGLTLTLTYALGLFVAALMLVSHSSKGLILTRRIWQALIVALANGWGAAMICTTLLSHLPRLELWTLWDFMIFGLCIIVPGLMVFVSLYFLARQRPA